MSDGPGSGTTTHLVRQRRARLRDSVRHEGLPRRRRDLPGESDVRCPTIGSAAERELQPSALRGCAASKQPSRGSGRWGELARDPTSPPGRARRRLHDPHLGHSRRARTRLAKSPTWLEGHAAELNVKYLMFCDHALAFPSLLTRLDATRTQRSHHQPDPPSSGPRHLSTDRRSPPLAEHQSPQS